MVIFGGQLPLATHQHDDSPDADERAADGELGTANVDDVCTSHERRLFDCTGQFV